MQVAAKFLRCGIIQRGEGRPDQGMAGGQGPGGAIPGFNLYETYETVIANRAPELHRRPAPDSVEEVLRWAPEPLATAEVAQIMRVDIEDARAALADTARFTAAGADGYWHLSPTPD